mgnify:CR=1 FL=1
MFHEVVADAEAGAERDADEVTAAMLLTSFETLVSEAVDEIGRGQIAAEAGIDETVVDAAVDGDAAAVRLEDGAAIVAAPTDRDGDAVVAEVRDHLLMGMATAVLDVDAIADGPVERLYFRRGQSGPVAESRIPTADVSQEVRDRLIDSTDSFVRAVREQTYSGGSRTTPSPAVDERLQELGYK